ncbi:MAG: phosphogluconate dehydrogenase (NAD(+)-dependent, decarboxylating) [Myxococcota bacterium]
MEIGFIGLGKMGAGMTRRLLRAGHTCTVFDQDPESAQRLRRDGATPVMGLDELVGALSAPRVVWVMLPSGRPTQETIELLSQRLQQGDTVIDGGNTFYKDDIHRQTLLQTKGIHLLDVGTSGGVWGLTQGYCLMIGGERGVYERCEPLFAALAPLRGFAAKGSGETEAPREAKGVANKAAQRPNTADKGYLWCGPCGSGHFVKMVHNGIEYGLMQAYAEGFELLRARSEIRDHVGDIAEVWRHGSVVRSWLLDLCARALREDSELSEYRGHVSDSGEGRWTVEAAIEERVPAHVLSSALYTRFRSRQETSFAEKILSAMRAGFGGHQEQK